jgi:hypothetical protein
MQEGYSMISKENETKAQPYMAEKLQKAEKQINL